MTIDIHAVGWWGERVVAAYLQRQGFTLLDHHYRKRWGEIDLVMSRLQKIHFVEVKTTTEFASEAVEATMMTDAFRPEQQVDTRKLDRLRRTAESWMDEFNLALDREIDVASVYLDIETNQAWVDVFWQVA